MSLRHLSPDTVRLAAIAIPFLVLAGMASERYGQLQRETVFAHMRQTAAVAAAMTDGRLDSHLRSLRIFEAGLGHGATVEQAFLRQAEFALPAEPEWIGLRLTGLIPQTPPITAGHPLFEGAGQTITHGGFSVSAVIKPPDAPPVLVLREDVRVGDSTFRLELCVKVWTFARPIKQIPLASGWYIGVIDHDGRLIARSRAVDERDPLIGETMPQSFAKALTAEGEVFEAVTAQGEPIYLVTIRSAETGWRAMVGVDTEVIVGPLRQTRLIVMGIAALCLALALAAGLAVAASQRRLAAAEAEREAKDLLTREVHHRVKNSLQAVSSLLIMQAAQNRDPAVRSQFLDATARVNSIAQVHERLYRSASGDSVDFANFLQWMASDLGKGLLASRPITLNVQASAFEMSSERAIPLALIVAELITNAAKYAFPEGRAGTVHVSFYTEGPEVCLLVEDDGKGLPPDFDPAMSQGLGMRLVGGLAKQIGARFTAQNREAGGARFVVCWVA